ncbi:MAG: GerMN domain-containing protein [Pseudobutyrivibrio sp.]|nr:GerMN domain-containing protein [Pseudobutyrivibrio sp.]
MKRFISLLLAMLMCLSMVACGKSEEAKGTKIYYVSTDKYSVVSKKYDFTATNTEGRIREALEELQKKPDELDYMATIPNGVDVSGFELNNSNLSVYLTGSYSSLEYYTEILVRAAIVRTLCQISGVESVTLYVDDAPLTDENGEAVGSMTADTFIDDFGEETDSLLSTELTLYFASADGMSVVPEKRQVYYSRNVSIEKLVIEQLLMGPDSKNLLSALPSGTKINSISISDGGICYVNFDAALETAVSGVTENVTVFSIVNSLTELDSVKQVQILVNGETPHLSNVEVDLSSAVSRNEDIIHDEADDEIEIEETEVNEDEL